MTVKPASGPYDVFLSHSVRDEALADVIRGQMSDFGLAVYASAPPELLRSPEAAEGVRAAIRGSTVFVVLLTPAHRDSPVLNLELGVAWMRRMPVYVLVAEGASDIPIFMRRFTVRPLSPLSEVIAKIADEIRPASTAQA